MIKRLASFAPLFSTAHLAPVLIAALALTAAPAVVAQGCCSGGATKHDCGSATAGGEALQGQHSRCGHVSVQNHASVSRLSSPAKKWMNRYLEAQTALAQDSLKNFRESVIGMQDAARQDTDDTLPAAISEQTVCMSKAEDLASARESFKVLSEILIPHLKAQKALPGVYREAYCSMAKARWVQTGNELLNPYMGTSMPHCGQFKS